MTQLFTENDKQAAYNTQKKLWWVFGITSFVFFALNALIFIFRYKMGYGLGMFLNIFSTAVYGGFLLFFFSIKFKLTRCFIKMLKGFEKGLREERMGVFSRFDDTFSVKDGVACYSMITIEHYDKRGTPSERMILIEATRPKPDFKEGDRLHYFTHANILVEYERFTIKNA